MANSISSELTISTAISTLQNMLAPLSDFTLDITSDVVGRQATVKVPVIDTDDAARAYNATTGYNTTSDTSVSVVSVDLAEHIKPFHLNDNDMNKSPLTLQNYARQNANEFGRYIMSLMFSTLKTAVSDTDIPTGNILDVDDDAVAIGNIKTIAGILDQQGANLDRHLLLGGQAVNNLLPSTIETFGSSVVESGRFNQLYGMSVSQTNAHGTLTTGDIHSLAAPSDAIVIVNRMPDTSGQATLEEYTPFTIDGLGIQCAYRRYYDASKGIHYGAFTTMLGMAVAKGSQVVVVEQVTA